MWEDLKPAQITSPKAILSNIANELNAVTKESIVFSVDTQIDFGYAEILSIIDKADDEANRAVRLKCSVPGLNNYTLHLIKVLYDIKRVYPCKVMDLINHRDVQAESKDELDSIIRGFLDDSEIKSIISNLWAQVDG